MRLTKSEIKYLRSLSQKKYREQERKFLLEGWLPLQEALASEYRIDFIASVLDMKAERQAVMEKAKKRSIQLKELTVKELGQVSSTVHAQGVVAVINQREYNIGELLGAKPSIVVALDAVSDPGNLGSIIRSCDWFGVDALLLGKGCVGLYNEKVVRSTAGSIFHLPIAEQVDLPAALKNAKQSGYTINALSGDGAVSYANGQLKPQSILVFGSEAHGISNEVRAVSDSVLSIPRFGSAESLNVGVACGIVLAHFRNARPTTPNLKPVEI